MWKKFRSNVVIVGFGILAILVFFASENQCDIEERLILSACIFLIPTIFCMILARASIKSYEKNKESLKSEIHELFLENENVEVSLCVTGEELEKIKEVLKKEQIMRLYAKLVDEEIRVTMKIGEEEYPDFFVYRNYSEFLEKFNVLK